MKGCNLEQNMSWRPQGALGDAQTDEGSGESAAILEAPEVIFPVLQCDHLLVSKFGGEPAPAWRSLL